MATTKTDAEYLERMVQLHPWRDADTIVAERAAHLTARRTDEGITPLNHSETAPQQRIMSIETGLLSPGWYRQECQVEVPVSRGCKGRSGQTDSDQQPMTWLWWVIGIVLLSSVVRGFLTARP